MSTAPTVSAPQCPRHGVPLREWAPGKFSCSVRMSPGEPGANANGFCDHRVMPPKPGGGGGGGGRSFQKSPEEQRAIAAQSVFSSACARFAGTQAAPDEIVELATAGFRFVMQSSAGSNATGSPSPRSAPVSTRAPATQPAFPGDEAGDPGPQSPW